MENAGKHEDCTEVHSQLKIEQGSGWSLSAASQKKDEWITKSAEVQLFELTISQVCCNGEVAARVLYREGCLWPGDRI